LYAQRSVQGADDVVFLGQGGAEQGHDPVPRELVDAPLDAMHLRQHQSKGAVEHLVQHLRINPLCQRRGSLQVGKAHCHMLALAFQGATGGEDLLGQILRGVGERRVCRVAVG
jgi:hypothetical protein